MASSTASSSTPGGQVDGDVDVVAVPEHPATFGGQRRERRHQRRNRRLLVHADLEQYVQ
jgi:hypothetical protein